MVAAVFYDDGVEELLVQVVHVLEDPVLKGGTDVDVVEDREVLHVLAQADAARVRADGHLKLPGHQEGTERTSLTPPRRQASTWQKLMAFACRSCLKRMRFWQCSPVTTPTGDTASEIRACPKRRRGS